MGESLCLLCKKPVSSNSRAKVCGDHHRWQAWWERTVEKSEHAQSLPLAALPSEAEEILPAGAERGLVAAQLVLVGKAPAGAFGYRVGIKHGRSKIMLWFPAIKFCDVGMFLLEPFQWPAVPVRGNYAVVYMDRRCQPIGGPRFTIAIEQTNPRLCYSDGDRTYKPRPRW